MMLLVKIIRGLFILVVVLSDVVLPQCQHPIRLDFRRTLESNQITFICRWCANISNVQDPHLFVNSTSTPLQFKRLDNGSLVFNISQELEGYYYCGASPNNISSNSKILIAYPQPRPSIPTQHSVEVGQTITIDCPIAVGALRGRYSFSWRKGLQTLDTTGPGNQYSVDPLNKSLTIANVQVDNNGTYYCDVSVSVPGGNLHHVPESFTEITLFVTELTPLPSTSTPTLKPSPPDQAATLIPLPTPLNGITSGSPRPSMTINPPVQPTAFSVDVNRIITITVPTITGFGVLLILALVLLGCIKCVCWRNNGSEAQKLRTKASKMEKEVCNMIRELSDNEAKRRCQEAVIEDKRKEIRSLREQAKTYKDENERRAKELRKEARTIEMEAERMEQNLDSDPHKKRILQGIIKDMRKEVKSLRGQAKRVRTDADGSDDDEDEENLKQAREMRTTPDGRSDDQDEGDYAAADGGSVGEVQDCEEIDKVWIETSL